MFLFRWKSETKLGSPIIVAMLCCRININSISISIKRFSVVVVITISCVIVAIIIVVADSFLASFPVSIREDVLLHSATHRITTMTLVVVEPVLRDNRRADLREELDDGFMSTIEFVGTDLSVTTLGAVGVAEEDTIDVGGVDGGEDGEW